MKIPPIPASLLARQTPAVRALLAKAQRRDPPVSTEVTRDGDVLVIVARGLRLPSLANMNPGPQIRAKAAQSKVLKPLLATLPRPPLPLDVEIVRMAPRMLDVGGNLYTSGKRLQDTIARWLGVDDRTEDRVRYTVRQEHGDVCVRIRIGPMNTG